MKRLRPLLQLTIALACLLACSCNSRRDLKPGRTIIRKQQLVIPAQIIGNQFIVETKWDKHGPWRFLIDTGSSVTLVSPEFQRRYATEKAALGAPAIHVRSSEGKATELPAVTIRSIEIGDARFESVQALIFDFSELSAHLGVKIDGVLGFPLFRETVFTLDYPQSRLVIKPAWPAPAPTPDLGTTIKFNNNQRTPLINVRIGAENVVALIDSGNDGPLLLNPVGKNPQFAFGPRPGVAVSTLTGVRTQEIARLDQPLDIGPFRFEKPVVDLSDQLTAIGGEILRNFAVTFDQSNNQVSFHRESTKPIASAARRTAGLSFSKTPTYWRVAGVVSGSPAEAAGIQTGDLVTRINGESISAWSYARYEAQVRRAEEITFTFLRGSTEVPVVVSLFDLVP
ncbi:MAG: aspartyl protease family protein [Nibricoccus sp.]